MNARDTVERYFRAMAAGPSAQDDLFALFAPDAEYVEPFSGQTLTHTGKPAIEAYLKASWSNSPPNLELTVDRVDVDGDLVRSDWTCTSPAFEAPVRGRDVCTVRDGLIQRLEVSFRGPE